MSNVTIANKGQYLDLIKKIGQMPLGPKRWRAAANFWLKVNPKSPFGLTARQETASMLEEIKLIKESRKDKKFGTSQDKNSAMRFVLSMPAGMMQTIQYFDPTLFESRQTLAKKKQKLAKLTKEFREFKIPEKI